ncbi:hypothetical protein C9374_001220 [Naegleria lovaniensis]|uniref:Uncharacterized protein n=1 Tax=Naegleria lovaniensis TaxID=51637 RepID=A0AA88KNJ1_NAELO|nr:uncharacterized protein C9374_001220 [Naegleria lovaniensis]KAG2387626.1 hypothetical protein C9374_001220 [Naegleria lovaniensis]
MSTTNKTTFDSPTPYYKALFHTFKFPFATTNGVFIGKKDSDDHVIITDCVPLCHSVSSICTLPLLEMALIQIDAIIGEDQSIVGYYFAQDVVPDTSSVEIPSIHLSVFSKICENFSGALLWMLDSRKLSELSNTFVFKTFYLKSPGKVAPESQKGDNKGLSQPDLEKLATYFENRTFDSIVDFEMHADNLSLDFMNKSL